jgi:hypothetical protein
LLGELGAREFTAPDDSISLALAELVSRRREAPPGTFVFLLSDFLAPPPRPILEQARDRGLDVVPVLIQDPVWEADFPAVAGLFVPVLDPPAGRLRLVRLSRRQVAARRALHVARRESLLTLFRELALDWVELVSHEASAVASAFQLWAGNRELARCRP